MEVKLSTYKRIKILKVFLRNFQYFDFAKAFDSVNHGIILYKLKYQFGIDGLMLEIIKEYLKSRNQRVVINGTLSSPLAV